MLRLDDAPERVREDVRVVAVAVPPLQFLQVTVKVLLAHLVERADDAALEQAPHPFDGVRVHVADNPLLRPVVHRLMAGVVVRDAEVGREFVRVDGLSLILDRLADELMERPALHVRDALQPYPAPALDRAGHPCLVALVSASLALRLTTYQRLVNLDDSEQRRPLERVIPHRRADAMAEVPRGLVRDSQRPLQLKGGHALLGLAHEVDGGEPLAERQVGVVHHGPGCDGELVAAGVAVELSASVYLVDVRGAAAEARHTVRPTQLRQQFAALCVGVIVVEEG